MLIENSFDVTADPDRVYAFLSDAHNVVACMPGAELVADLGDDSYQGRIKMKIGPVTAAYSGTATITERDPAGRVAVLLAEGKDVKGNGGAKATATMRVEPAGSGSTVQLVTDLSVSGKLAQFGRSVMADVSNRMVRELAARVRAAIEAESVTAAGSGAVPADQPAGTAPVTTVTAPVTAPAREDAIKASGIVWSVLAGLVRRLFARLRGVRESG
jgi:carbon monoxide dehydrogenase subunit G